jgi:hypothetical protein
MAALTITVPDPQVPRVQAAVGRAIGLIDGQNPPQPRDATADEVRQYLVDLLVQVTRREELRDAVITAEAGVSDIDATI